MANNKKLAQGAIGTAPGTKAYQVPSGGKALVKDIEISNTTAGALTITLHIVPVGTSVAASNMLFPTFSIPANKMVQWSGEQVMDAGDFIQVIGSGSGLTMNISGEEVRQ